MHRLAAVMLVAGTTSASGAERLVTIKPPAPTGLVEPQHADAVPYVADVLAVTASSGGTLKGLDASGRPVVAVPVAVSAQAFREMARAHMGQGAETTEDETPEVAHPLDELVLETNAPGGRLQVIRNADAGGGITPAMVDAAKHVAGVQAVEPNYRFVLIASPSASAVGDPDYGQQWGLQHIQADKAWERITASDLPIAIIDTGILHHPDVMPNVTKQYDAVDGDCDALSGAEHGTKVASVIAATKDGKGITGVLHTAQLMPVRAFASAGALDCPGAPDDGCTDISRLVAGIDWAVANGATVINASWAGIGANSMFLPDASARAGDAGVVFVASAGLAGNCGVFDLDAMNPPNYPAAWSREMDNVITVMESDGEDGPVGVYGAKTVHLAAPGSGILMTNGNNAYGNAIGVSFSVPFVTAAVAMVRTCDPSLTPRQVRDLLIEKAKAHANGADKLKDKCEAGAVLDVGFLAETCTH
jgi:hypothetical protein